MQSDIITSFTDLKTWRSVFRPAHHQNCLYLSWKVPSCADLPVHLSTCVSVCLCPGFRALRERAPQQERNHARTHTAAAGRSARLCLDVGRQLTGATQRRAKHLVLFSPVNLTEAPEGSKDADWHTSVKTQKHKGSAFKSLSWMLLDVLQTPEYLNIDPVWTTGVYQHHRKHKQSALNAVGTS